VAALDAALLGIPGAVRVASLEYCFIAQHRMLLITCDSNSVWLTNVNNNNNNNNSSMEQRLS
jgi:hypothetical protein